MNLISYIVCTSLTQFVTSAPPEKDLFELPIIHLNDFHSRYEETSLDSGLCKSENCIGGFSRLHATILDLLDRKPNSILLNAGDNFEGTLWYNVHKWNVTQYFFNKLPFDAFTLGNHEFEDKIEGLVPFLENLESPVVVANVDASKEPSLQGLLNKSVIIERGGLKIGVIGVIVSTIDELADTGQLIFSDEIESVNAEAERLVLEENVFTNIVLSHCGYDLEQQMAKNTSSRISVIVGGHSHSFLYTGEPVPGPDIPAGPYPTVVENSDGKLVLVLQASSYSKYLGNIAIFYNKDGDIVDWTGAPIFLDTEMPQDEEINEELVQWKEVVDKESNKIVGSTTVRLDQSRCSMAECLLGNFVTDAMVFGYIGKASPGSWSNASVAVMHAGGLRSGIDVGNISYSEIVSAQPFENTIDVGEIKGEHLKEILESSVGDNYINLLQVSGMQAVYNLSNPSGLRLISLRIRCLECDIPTYEDLEMGKTYRIILPSFLANGGFGFTLFKNYLKNRIIGSLDIDLLVNYVKARSPIFQEIQGRIQIYD